MLLCRLIRKLNSYEVLSLFFFVKISLEDTSLFCGAIKILFWTSLVTFKIMLCTNESENVVHNSRSFIFERKIIKYSELQHKNIIMQICTDHCRVDRTKFLHKIHFTNTSVFIYLNIV